MATRWHLVACRLLAAALLSGCLGGQTGQGDPPGGLAAGGFAAMTGPVGPGAGSGAGGNAPALPCIAKKMPLNDPAASGISIALMQGGSEPLTAVMHFNRRSVDDTLRVEIVKIVAARLVTPVANFSAS